MKTLVVEDDPITLVLFERLLAARGYEVTACRTAEAAWAAYQQEAYPLVVLDWMLPGMDGLQLCRRMRTLPHGDRSVIVVCTARDRPEDLQAVLDAGGDDYVTKPVELERLRVRLTIAERHVRNLTERKRAEARVADVLGEIERSRDDMLSILNQLRVGTAMTDAAGRVTFLSEAGRRVLGRDEIVPSGQHWADLFPFSAEAKAQLHAMAERPQGLRTKVPAHSEVPGGRHRWVDVEVRDDPRDPLRKIFFLYDVSEVHDLRRLLDEKAQFADLVGKSGPMLAVFQQIREMARVDSTVLIEGETGTGKELVARAIHFSSHRKDKPFIAVNSAGLTDSLLASQLFGHKRGAFTDAIEEHKGVFEAAEGGTIFLDEIGDIPLNVQISLLRVLEQREITRVGEAKPRKIDVRILAATHRNLNEAVATGQFRADLLYRVRVARIQLPALRERREDIPLLVGSFLGLSAAITRKALQNVSQEAIQILLQYDWPGNVRELKNAIEFAAIRCVGVTIEAGDLPPEIAESPGIPLPPGGSPQDERQRVAAALARARGNRSVAARLLGVSRATFYRRLADLDVVPRK